MQIGDKHLEVSDEMKELLGWLGSGGDQDLGADFVAKVRCEFILCFVCHHFGVVHHQSWFEFSCIVESFGLWLFWSFVSESLCFFQPLEFQLLLLLGLFLQVLAVNFASLELVVDVAGIACYWTLDFSPIDGLFALQRFARVFLWRHD